MKSLFRFWNTLSLVERLLGIAMLLLAAGATAALVTNHTRGAREWQSFKATYACKKTASVGIGVTANPAPMVDAWTCSDGVVYWRRASLT